MQDSLTTLITPELKATYADGYLSPAKELLPYIRRYCFRSVPADGPLPVTATGKSVVMLLIGDSPDHAALDDAYDEVLTAAPPTLPMHVHAPGSQLSFIGVEFTPIGYLTLLGHPPQELGDGMKTAGDVLSPTLFQQLSRTVHHRIRRGETWRHDLDAFFMQRIPRRMRRSSYHALNFSQLVLAQPSIRIRDAAAELGVSTTLLRRAVTEVSGLSPKQYATSQLMERAFIAVASSPRPKLVDLALALGMHDEAHFHHTFRNYAGVTPSEVTRERFRLALAGM